MPNDNLREGVPVAARESGLNIGVLISGSGTNLQAIIDAVEDGTLNANIVCVISSRPDAFGIQRAEKAGIPVRVLDKTIYENPVFADEIIKDELFSHSVDYVVMAGYMRKLTNVVLDAFPDKVLNLHPALLPSFKGAHAIQDAWDAGVKVTGVTVHLANEDYDKGPIVAQRAVHIYENDDIDSLEARIHKTEHVLLVEVLKAISKGCMSIDSNRVVHIK